MPSLWNPTLTTGIKQIDEQHKQLLDQIGELLSLAGSPSNVDKVKEIINFLDNYVKYHFSTEEVFMKTNGYPETNPHLEQHKYFNIEFAKIKGILRDKGINLELKLKLNNLLSEWFIKHISQVDKKLSNLNKK